MLFMRIPPDKMAARDMGTGHAVDYGIDRAALECWVSGNPVALRTDCKLSQLCRRRIQVCFRK